MNLSNIDCKDLMFNPLDESALKELQTYDEFREDFGVDPKKALVYLIIVYDLNTPLRTRYPLLTTRKNAGADIAGFPRDLEGEFEEEYSKLVFGGNKNFSKAIAKFVRLFGSTEYITLVMLWTILANEWENTQNTKDSSKYKDTIKNIQELNVQIKKYEQTLFGGDETIDVKRALYEAVEKESFRTTRPEDIALATNKEELNVLLDNPYGDDYTPDQLHFVSDR
jgi:hypothetical protein